MFGLGLPEIIIILILAAIFFVDGDQLSAFAKGLGKFTKDFQNGKEELGKNVAENDKISELSRGLGRFTEEFKKGREEVEIQINKFKK